MKNIILAMLCCCILLSCKKSEAKKDPVKVDPPVPVTPASKWYTEINYGNANISWIQTSETSDGKLLMIKATDQVCAQTYQELTLEPFEVYQFSANIKTENVSGDQGAVISLRGSWINSEKLTGNNSAQKEVILFQVPESGKVQISCSLGFNGMRSSGSAYFTEMKVEKADISAHESQHVIVKMKPELSKTISDADFDKWLGHLDLVYEAYADLLGGVPFGGKKNVVLAVPQDPHGWAVAGFPIYWSENGVAESLRNIKNHDDWSFGIMHEMGHNFCSGGDRFGSNENWNWNDEMFANFRMYYAVETLSGRFYMNSKVYQGADAKTYYETDGGDSYKNAILKGRYAHDALMFTLIRIKEKVGWEPFKKTFKWLYNNPTNFTNSWQKFDFFLEKLSAYSDEDVRSTYPAGELDLIKNELQKN